MPYIANGNYEAFGFVIRAQMVDALKRYANEGQVPGDFLQAVICNNLVDACARADGNNKANIPAFAVFLFNEMPAESWGSIDKMNRWEARFEDSRRASDLAMNALKGSSAFYAASDRLALNEQISRGVA